MKPRKGLVCLFSVFLFFGVCNLAFSETITLATLNWEPYFGETLSGNGVFAQISRVAFARSGYELQIEFVPWKRALEGAKSGYYDGLLGAYQNSEREEFFYFTDSIMQTVEVLICRSDANIDYTVIRDLKPYSIGAIRGFSYTDWLLQEGFYVEEARDDLLNLKKLSAGRLDLVIIEESRYYYLFKQEGFEQFRLSDFTVMSPPFQIFDLYCTIDKEMKNSQLIIESFNKALAEMKQDGTYKRILDYFTMSLRE